MSVIERHWIADIPGYAGPFIVEDNEADLARYPKPTWRVHGPYVLEPSTTPGAVEDANALRTALGQALKTLRANSVEPEPQHLALLDPANGGR